MKIAFCVSAGLMLVYSLTAKPGVNPPLTLEVLLEARLVRRSGARAGNLFVHYRSPPRGYVNWARDDARLLRETWKAAWPRSMNLSSRGSPALHRRRHSVFRDGSVFESLMHRTERAV